MPRCPLCESAHITIVIDRHRHAFCSDCGARWVQDGSQQHTIKRIQQPALTAPPRTIA
jgi:hypothetical protein